jgi:beta-glucosidase
MNTILPPLSACRLLLLSGLLFIPLSHHSTALAAHSAITPSQRTDEGSKRRFDELLKRVREEGPGARIVFLGDSITQGWEGAGREVWERYYGPRKALNLGIGGDRTQHVLWRLQNGHAEGLDPKVVVLMIGTNNSNGEDNTPGQIAEGVAAIVRLIREKMPNARVLLSAIFPRGENFSAHRGKILQVNQVIRKLADGHTVQWLDFGHDFVEADGLIAASVMPDYLHLSPQGYRIWAESMEPALAGLLGDTPLPASTAGRNVAGEWIWKIRGPDGQTIEAPLFIEQDGEKLGGRFARGPDRWLPIENGKIAGDQLSWTVKRDRPNGGTMTYRMTATVGPDGLKGKVITEMDGNEATEDWSARRK